MVDGVGDEIRELRSLLDTVQSISHIGTWEWTIATGAVTWSPELYRIYGLEPSSVEITLEYFLSRIHPNERERIQREIQAVLSHPGRFGYREVIVRPDGSHRTLDTVGEAVTDEHGAVRKLVGTCCDVTDIVHRDERLMFYAEVFEHAQIGLSGWQIDRSETPARLRLVAFNAKTEALVGTPLGGKLGQRLVQILPSLEGSQLLADARTMNIASPIRRYPPFVRSTTPDAPWLAATLFPMPGNRVGLVLEDVTSLVHTEILQTAERRALELLAGSALLPDILGIIVRALEQVSPGTIASVLLLDDSGTRVTYGCAPSLPDSYNKAIEGELIGPRAGSCGTAMFRRERVVVGDIASDPLWIPYRDLAAKHGLAACWSQPIIGNEGRVLGAFALYHRQPNVPDEYALELLERAAHVTGIVLDRRGLDAQLRALAERLEEAREDERTTIARDLHDALGQALTALKLDIGWLRRRAEQPPVVEKLDDMARSTDELIRSVQRISSDLRPGILDNLGLVAAIEWQAEEFERRSNIRCEVTSSVTDLQLERNLATNVFRILQEALTNIARHSQATKVDITLALVQGNLQLEIADDGIGMPDLVLRSSSLGILGMRERAGRAAGECVVKRREPNGTVVAVTVPLRFPSEA